MILALKGNGKQGTLLIPECMLLWFNFILGSNFIYSSNLLSYNILPHPKAKKIKFEPRIKLNHNIYTCNLKCLDRHMNFLQCTNCMHYMGAVVHEIKFFTNFIYFEIPLYYVEATVHAKLGPNIMYRQKILLTLCNLIKNDVIDSIRLQNFFLHKYLQQ